MSDIVYPANGAPEGEDVRFPPNAEFPVIGVGPAGPPGPSGVPSGADVSAAVNVAMAALGLYTAPRPARLWAGAVTPSSFRVNFDVVASIGAEILTAGLVVSTNADLSLPVFTAPDSALTVSSGRARAYYTRAVTVTGLAANTRYYYCPRVNGVTQTAFLASLTTAPTAGTANSFSFVVGSCTNAAYVLANIWAPLQAEGARFLVHLGDAAYSDVSVDDARVQRDTNTRSFRDIGGVQAMLQTTPCVYMFDDHDSAGDDNHYDSLYYTASTNTSIIVNSRAVVRETTPLYPTMQDAIGWGTIGTNLLAQQWDWGRVRFLMPDLRSQRRWKVGTPTIMGNGTNPPGSWDQLSAVLAAIAQAATDGKKILFFISSSTWVPAIFDSWETHFSTEQAAVCNAIRDANIQVVLIQGDSHQCGIDDGTNSDRSSTRTGKFPVIIASPLFTGAVFHQVTPLAWNGGDGDISGPVASSSPTPGTGNATTYTKITVTDNGGDDIHWSAVFKGAPVSGSAATVLGDQAAYTDTDAAVTVGFQSSATLNIVTGTTAVVPATKTWFGPVTGCSAAWSASSGASGALTFKPNANASSISIPYTSGADDLITLASPVNCTLGANSTLALHYFTPQAETTAYLAAMSVQPTAFQLAAIDALIAGLKADGVWAKILKMWWLAAHDQQASLLNMKAPGTNDLTANGALTYVPYAGWRSHGDATSVSGYLESNYAIPGANQNSVSMFLWTTTAAIGAPGEMGGHDYYINPNGAAADTRTRSSSTTSNSIASTLGASIGDFGWSRTGSANYTTYLNGAVGTLITQVSATPSVVTQWVCGFQDTGGASQYGQRTNAFAMIGSGLTAGEVANLYARRHTFLQAMGTVA